MRMRLSSICRRGIHGQTGRRAEFAGFLAGALLASAAVCWPLSAAETAASDGTKQTQKKPDLPKAFRGRLPITELTEDEATMHALNRLAYGPRPGDLERVKQMGLEKWIDLQLHPDRIDDSAVAARLQQYPALTLSTEQLLARYPNPNQQAKQQGVTRQQFQQQQRQAQAQGLGDGQQAKNAPRQIVM